MAGVVLFACFAVAGVVVAVAFVVAVVVISLVLRLCLVLYSCVFQVVVACIGVGRAVVLVNWRWLAPGSAALFVRLLLC